MLLYARQHLTPQKEDLCNHVEEPQAEFSWCFWYNGTVVNFTLESVSLYELHLPTSAGAAPPAGASAAQEFGLEPTGGFEVPTGKEASSVLQEQVKMFYTTLLDRVSEIR